jgi:hypothetical protein
MVRRRHYGGIIQLRMCPVRTAQGSQEFRKNIGSPLTVGLKSLTWMMIDKAHNTENCFHSEWEAVGLVNVDKDLNAVSCLQLTAFCCEK